MEPDEMLEMMYEESQAPTLLEDGMDVDEEGPDCEPDCHQGSHSEHCEWYAWAYETDESKETNS